MSVMRKSRRPKRSKKRVDLSSMRDLLRDDRLWNKLARVTEDDDSGSHFDLDGEDLIIECELIPGEERVSARMGIGGAGAGQGIWFIPPVGSEVMLGVPDGEIENGAVLVAVLSTGSLPDGIAEGVTVITNSSKVVIHDGSGGEKALAYKSDVEAVEARLSSHIHVTTATVGAGATPGVISPTTAPPANIEGTQVLEAK